jgi:hypothetical protein
LQNFLPESLLPEAIHSLNVLELHWIQLGRIDMFRGLSLSTHEFRLFIRIF